MLRYALVVSTIVILAVAVNVQADVFSLDLASETIQDQALDFEAADLLGSGPNIHVASDELGLQTGDDLNALSAGLDIVTLNDIIYFSVDRLSAGVPPTGVSLQAQLNEQAGDIFVTVNTPITGQGVMNSPRGDNALVYDDDGLLAPGFGILGGNMDNLDAYSQDEFDFSTFLPGHDVPVYFSLAAGSASLGMAGSSSADILVSYPDTVANTGTFHVWKNSATLGLTDADDLDALALEYLDLTAYPGGPLIEEAYFSLAPGSLTLAGLDGVFGTLDDLSAADIFYTDFTFAFTLAYTAESLGLLEGDNVDALETNAVPEPATMALLGLGGVALLLKRRRR